MDGTTRDRQERVRRVLIEPMLARGMRKPKGRTAEEHEAFLVRLERRLAYLGEGHLATLAEAVERNAEGASRNVWPSEVSIVNWAGGLEPRPDEDSRLIRSYLGSAAGLRKWTEAPAYAVSLRKFLRERGRPPSGEYDWREIDGRAERWLVDIERWRRFAAEGIASVEQRDALAAFDAEADRVRSMVFAAAEEGAA